jgi:hypothetical protein
MVFYPIRGQFSVLEDLDRDRLKDISTFIRYLKTEFLDELSVVCK